jgi:hypothetical protein
MINAEISILQEEEIRLIAKIKETRGVVQDRSAKMTRARELADSTLKELSANTLSAESNRCSVLTKKHRAEAEDQYQDWLEGSTN